MRRKLKPLHQVLEMEGEYIYEYEAFSFKDGAINSKMIPFFGKEIEVSEPSNHYLYKYFYNGWNFKDTWFEPVKEKEVWYQAIVKEERCLLPLVHDYLYRSREHFLDHNNKEESDYEWIKLIPVYLEEVV